jgi:flagellar FliJ protein
VDKVVWLRERAEDGALASLARARAEVDRARDEVAKAIEGTRRDTRAPGRIELWVIDDDGHRRAIQTLHAAQGQVHRAAEAESQARDGYTTARQGTLAVRRVQERRRADQLIELNRRDRRELDEIATLRFNTGPR